MRREVWLGGVALFAGAAGAVLGGWLLGAGTSDPEPPLPGPAAETPPSNGTAPGPSPAELIAEINALGEALQQEAESRRQLEWEVAMLRELLADLDRRVHAPGGPAGAPEETAVSERTPGGEEERARARREEAPVFDEEALVALGIDPVEAERLRERYEEAQLERLYLRDRATREGWVGTRRHFGEAVGLEMKLRQELGDERYDQMLYAAGRRNRVVVRDVLSHSPAEQAGFEPGDVILSYDGRRIFRASELQAATSRGELGDYTRVEILRDGERRTLSVPRGPLGTLLREVRAAPELR